MGIERRQRTPYRSKGPGWSHRSRRSCCSRCCRACCKGLLRTWLLLLNLVDGVAGVALVGWGLYMRFRLTPGDTTSEAFWTSTGCMTLGGLLTLQL